VNPEQGPDLDERDLEQIAALLDGRLEGAARQQALDRLDQNEQAYQIYVESARFLDWQQEQEPAAPTGEVLFSAPRSRWRWLAAVAALALLSMAFWLAKLSAPQTSEEFLAVANLAQQDERLAHQIFSGLEGGLVASDDWPPWLRPVLEPLASWRAASLDDLAAAMEVGTEHHYQMAGLNLDPDAVAAQSERLAMAVVVGRQRERLRLLLEGRLDPSLEKLDRFDLAFYLFALGSPDLAVQQFASLSSELAPGFPSQSLAVANNLGLVQLLRAHEVLSRCSSNLATAFLPPMAYDLRRPFRVKRGISEEWAQCEANFDPLLDEVLFSFTELIARDPSYEPSQVNYLAALLLGHRGDELAAHLELLPEGLRSTATARIFTVLAPLALRYDVCQEDESLCASALTQLDDLRATTVLPGALEGSLSYNRAMILRQLGRVVESELELQHFLEQAAAGIYVDSARSKLDLDKESVQPLVDAELQKAIVRALDRIDPNQLDVLRQQQIEIGSSSWRLLRPESSTSLSLVVASETQTVLAVRLLDLPANPAEPGFEAGGERPDLLAPRRLDLGEEDELAGFHRLSTLVHGQSGLDNEIWMRCGLGYRVRREADGRRRLQAQILVRPGFLERAAEEIAAEIVSDVASGTL